LYTLANSIFSEPKSKRVPVRLRHKIEKASANKQRKAKKLAKKVCSYCAIILQHANVYQNPEWRSKLKKDPGIPNLFPYKDKILQEIEEKRRLKAEEAAQRREAAKAQKNGGDVPADAMEDSEEEEEELLDLDSEQEDSMQVVSHIHYKQKS
jgi:nuclear GTP-binding protein